ncbi:M23 family metallopeptidase (plasmid) [Paenibacillus peoriae]|uniref:M23 family metallopeptidase n=1 Tax=Paenibacillus peoriae TaxID=59893 RepID=A0A7H0YH63_9BACL|nr:M23 family metallopeptidase [Paenibacillus peoriae]QNR70421.1 M23 family metallopeptidase [Paenibacillus peoriae]
MGINNSLYPNDASLTEIMHKVNAFGHEPRVIVELDKFSYVPGLKHKFNVVEYVKKTVMKTVTVYTAGEGDDDDTNASVTAVLPAVVPIDGKQLKDLVLLSRHGSVNAAAPLHKGLDIATTDGEKIIATWPGTVVEAKYRTGYGNQVLLDHGNGFKTRYAQLSKMSVKLGDKVKQAQEVGLAGQAKGENSEGTPPSRLHFEVIKEGKTVNPEPYLNGTALFGNGTGVSTSKKITKTGTEVLTYQSNYRKGYEQTKYPGMSESYAAIHTVSTALGTKYMMGFKDLESASSVDYFTFKHTWFNDGYMKFDFYANLGNPGDLVKVKMDGKILYKFSVNGKGIYNPPAFDIPKGSHTFTFSMENTSHLKKDPQVFGITDLKCAEFGTVSNSKKTNTNWAFHDPMNSVDRWLRINGSLAAARTGGYVSFYENVSLKDIGIYRKGDVKFPMTVQATLRVSSDAELAHFVLSDGNTKFNIRFDIGSTTGGQGDLYVVNNTQWQDYLFIAKDSNTMVVYHRLNGEWSPTGITVHSVPSVENTIKFMRNGGGKGGMDISDVKYTYSNIFYSTSAGTEVVNDPDGEETLVDEDVLVPVEKQVPVETIEEKVTPKWYDLGGFAYDTTYYLEDDIISWEINTHMDMSSTTAQITLNNTHGLYSPEYVRASIFPDNKLANPYSYVENGIIRHIISENTPVRIYVGYGSEVVRVFTGMIKGEIQENSTERTLTFSCVDRFDLLEEAIVLEQISFPPTSSGSADTQRPWIKSSIIQYLANEGGMVGWRYNYEDIMHPDLVIEETYYTDVSQSEGTFMKFDSNGKLVSKSLTDAKTASGFMNPFVQAITFSPGERLSDCIRTVADEINFRAYCNRYGSFILEHVDYENNMKWEFVDGDNLYSLTSSSDFSRVRNHLQIVGSMGNVEHFFDKDLYIATKGAFRSAQLALDWIDESTGVTARGAKQVVADKLFFDMKRQARTKNVVIKGNPFIEVLDGCWIYDGHSSTAGYYIIKGNRMSGNQDGFVNQLELTWEEKVNY